PRGGGPEAGDARATRKNVRGHGTGRADEGKGQGVTMAGDLIRREALERIIQRAAELQAGEQDIGEGLTGPELLALGQDVAAPARRVDGLAARGAAAAPSRGRPRSPAR